MADKKVKVTVNAKTADSEKKLGRVKRSITAIKLAAVAAATIGLVLLKKAFTAVTVAAGIQEDALAAMAQQLKTNGESVAENVKLLAEHAAALQTVTKYGDEQTIAAQTALLAFGLTAKEVKGATSALQDFVAGSPLINDMKTAVRLLGLAYAGETSMLKRYGIVIDNNLSKQEKFKAVIESINKSFSGAARAAAETYTGKVTQMKNAWGDLTESVGFFITKNENMRGFIENLTGGFAKMASILDRYRTREDESTASVIEHTKALKDQKAALTDIGESITGNILVEMRAEREQIAIDLARKKRQLGEEKDINLANFAKTQQLAEVNNLKREAELLDMRINALNNDANVIGSKANILVRENNKEREKKIALTKEEEQAQLKAGETAFKEMQRRALYIQRFIKLTEAKTKKEIEFATESAEAALKAEDEKFAAIKEKSDTAWETHFGMEKSRSEQMITLKKEEARAKLQIAQEELNILQELQERYRQQDIEQKRQTLEDEETNWQDKKEILADFEAQLEQLVTKIEAGDLTPSQIKEAAESVKEIADATKSIDDRIINEMIVSANEGLKILTKSIDETKIKIRIDDLIAVSEGKKFADIITNETKKSLELMFSRTTFYANVETDVKLKSGLGITGDY
jgi:hypothetical protein